MPELGYSTSHFWDIAGLLLIACNAVWPFVVAIVALLVAARKKQGFAFVALFGALLAAAGHAVRLSGVTVHSSSANIPLPLVSENYVIYFCFSTACLLAWLFLGLRIFMLQLSAASNLSFKGTSQRHAPLGSLACGSAAP